jgi:hypothetical protein
MRPRPNKERRPTPRGLARRGGLKYDTEALIAKQRF